MAFVCCYGLLASARWGVPRPASRVRSRRRRLLSKSNLPTAS